MAQTQKVSIDREPIVKELEDKIKNLSFRELADLSEIEKDKELRKIEKKVNNYLLRYEELKKEVNNKLSGLEQKMAKINIDDPIKKKNIALYQLYKELLSEKNNKIDINNFLMEGYILVETLRKTFTGQEITYEIGMIYGKGGNRQLINKTISLAELLSYAQVDIQWGMIGMGGLKLRASSNLEDFNKELQKRENEIEIYIQNKHSLYPKILSVLSDKGYKNLGNIYEVYQQFKHDGWQDHPPKSKNPNNLKASQIVDKYMSVRSGTQSFVSGGDIEKDFTQVKLLSSNPSIASLNTIGKALYKIQNYIYQGKSKKVTIENIQKKVFSKEFDKKFKEPLNDLVSDIENELTNAIS